jgi:hypothetical protein
MAGEIVFVHLGPEPVEYLPHFVKHARRFSPFSRIILVISARHDLFNYPWADHAIELVATEDLETTDVHRSFIERKTWDDSFWNGFFRLTIERFFVLESAFRHLALRSAFHAEYDNLLFFDAGEMAALLAPLYPGIGATFDSPRRAIPGVVYVNDANALSKLTAFIDHFISRHDNPATLTDMAMLKHFQQASTDDMIAGLPIMTPDYCGTLQSYDGIASTDISMFTNHFDIVQSVFDGAAIGQFLYGIDPRHKLRVDSRGFINEETILDPRFYRYAISSDGKGRLRPYIQSAAGSWPINNLHIHSKQILQLGMGPITVPEWENPASCTGDVIPESRGPAPESNDRAPLHSPQSLAARGKSYFSRKILPKWNKRPG